jgi:glycosyltransferase involved in cell wall biosynthesis
MKILYNHQIFLQKFGGVARYFVELANNIALYKNKETTVKIISPFFKTDYLQNINQKILFNGLRVSDFKGSVRLCSIMNSLLSPILSKRYAPNIIHDTYYNAVKFNNGHIKKIITVHDMIHELFPDQFPKENKTTKLKKFAVAEADHVICVSKNTQKDLINFYDVDINKTSVIHHGFSFRTREIKKPLKTTRPYLLYVGSRDGYKNFTRFVEAYSASKIKNFFDLVIFGGEKLNEKEIAIFDRLQISKKSLIEANGDDATLAGYYKNASLFVYPSLYEGFGIPPLEAMHFGCPVVCSNAGSIPEVVGNAALLFDPYSVESIRNSIISVLYNDKLKLSLTSRGFKQLINFSWEKCAKETYKIYEEVLK